MDGNLLFYMGIDNISATLFDINEVEVITVSKEINVMIDEEYVEQDPEQWYSVFIEIINEIQSSGLHCEISSIAVTYQPGTFVCIDRAGVPITNAILACDKRAKYQAHMCEKTIKKHGDGYYIPWNYMILPRVLWIKYNKPNIYRSIFKVLTPDSYIAYKLSGEAAIDNYSALFLGYNIDSNDYNLKLLNNLGLERDMLPDIGKLGDCIGIISGDVREKLMLKSDVKILISSNCLSPLFLKASSNEKNNVIFDIESSNICMSNDVKIRNEKRLLRLPFKGTNVYSSIGNYEIQFLKWALRSLKDLESDTTDYSPGSNGVMVLPYIMGDNAFYRLDTKGSIIGIGCSSKHNIVTATYESIGYILNNWLEYISHYNITVESVEVLCNIKDKLFYQILSDITAKKILIGDKYNSNVKYIYKYFMQKNDQEAMEKDTIIIPDKEKNQKYKQLIGLYKSAYNSLNDVYNYRRKVLKRIMT